MKIERTYYDLTAAQSIALYQCKYSLFKRVINILLSASVEEDIDFELLKKAFNEVVKRNDCIRDRFTKKGKKVVQYFLNENEVKFDHIECLKFETKEEQEAFINKLTKKAVKYMKGEVIIPYFIKTYDNKSMVLLKVCHLILDMYGICFILNDLFDVYYALKNNTEMPSLPSKYEDLVIKDLERITAEFDYKECKQFFEHYLSSREEPYYAGISGKDEPNWVKRQKKHKRTIQLFFVKNDTKGYKKEVSKELVESLIELSKEKNIPFTSLLFFACSVCCGLLNDNTRYMFPLELLNCRASQEERMCGGTKAQSLACYTDIDYSKSFMDNLHAFYETQIRLNKRYYFPDTDFEMLIHKTYGSSFFGMYYSIAFSFIPYVKKHGIEYNIYSNEKCALPCYLIFLYDIENNEMQMGYDVQTKITSEKDVDNYHQNLLSVLEQIVKNPNIPVEQIETKNYR